MHVLFAVPARVLRSIARATMRLFTGLALMAALCAAPGHAAAAAGFPVPETQQPAVVSVADDTGPVAAFDAAVFDVAAFDAVAGESFVPAASAEIVVPHVHAWQPLCAKCFPASGERAPPAQR